MMEASYRQRTSLEKVRTLWIGGLKRSVVDENFLYDCFAHTGQVQSVRIIRNRISGLPEGYGFIEFISHEAAEKVLQTYNGVQMPGTEHTFRLNWASLSCVERSPHEGPDRSKGKEAAIPSVGKINRRIVCDADERHPYARTNHSNGGYCSTRPMRISAAIPNTFSGNQLQNKAAKAAYPAAAYTIPQSQHVLPDRDLTSTVEGASGIATAAGFHAPGMEQNKVYDPMQHNIWRISEAESEVLEVKVGTLSFPINNLISLPLRIRSVSVHPTVLVERKKKKKKKKKKRTGSTSSASYSLSDSSTVGFSAPPRGQLLPVWNVPSSGLPCGCPWPASSLDAINIQPTQYGLHQLLPDEPNEIIASFKPWLQRFYGYGGTIPCPRDLVTLEAFKQKCPLSEPFVLHDGKEIGVTTDAGRFVLVGLVEDIINTFKSGFSWGGDFSKDDLAVQIGVRCYISKVANLPGTYKNLCKDLDQMAEALIPHFRGVHKNKIAFIEHLHETMKNPPPLSSTAQKRQRYLKFLKSHPAFADPLSVSSLLVGIAQTYKSMGLSDKKAFETAVHTIKFDKTSDWRDEVKSHLLWNQVYTVKQRKSIKKKMKERYACTAIGLSVFLRHFIIHSPEYTLDGGVQLMKTIDEVDYLVADLFDNFIAKLFEVLVYEFDMDKNILKSVWRMYDSGEDRREVIRRIWKCESELDFMLEPQELTLTQSHVEVSTDTSGQAMADDQRPSFKSRLSELLRTVVLPWLRG